MAKCKHKTVERFVILPFGTVAFRCANWGCNAMGVRSLGPSNYEPVEVRVEMLAAGLYARGYNDAPPFSDAGFMSLFGFANHEKQLDKSAAWPPDSKEGEQWWAGWLLAEMSSHGNRETRDASAWPWDPTRPIAEQQPGNAACPKHPTANRNADGDCIECAREHTEAAQAEEDGIRRSLTDPDDDAPIDPAAKFSEMARQVTVPVVALDDWHCPVESNECTIRRQCTNKCGAKDPPPDSFDDEVFDHVDSRFDDGASD